MNNNVLDSIVIMDMYAIMIDSFPFIEQSKVFAAIKPQHPL